MAVFYGERNIPNTTVANNVIYNIATSGIQAEAGDGGSGGNLSSLRIANNVVLSTCLLVRDCGSLYVQDINATGSNIRVINNFVRDSGTLSAKARSIYLDDGVSGATVSNNISTGVFNFAFTIHRGSNNSIVSNIVDLGPSNNREILLYQGDGVSRMIGNVVRNNVIVSAGAGGWYEGKLFGAQPTITTNIYHHYAGTPIYTRGLGGLKGDASPVSVDPQLSCWTYVLAAAAQSTVRLCRSFHCRANGALQATTCRRPARLLRRRIPVSERWCELIAARPERREPRRVSTANRAGARRASGWRRVPVRGGARVQCQMCKVPTGTPVRKALTAWKAEPATPCQMQPRSGCV